MKVNIQASHHGMPYNINTFSALLGFQQMGFETVLFHSKEELKHVSPNNIIVGGVGRVKGFLGQNGEFLYGMGRF